MKDKVSIAVGIILLTCAASARELNKRQAGEEAETSLEDSTNPEYDSSFRLPSSLLPTHYLVRLQPFVNGNLSINGYVEITFTVVEPTDKIVLHISDIITKNETAKVYPEDKAENTLSITSQQFDPKKEFYIVQLDEPLQKGSTYVLALRFEGFLNDDLKGFYKSSYKKPDGSVKLLATTQFQATDARKAFPCFDEPALKAKFSIVMGREQEYNTISNMPLKDTVPIPDQEGWYWDSFETSLPMSTYLVAFVVSDFGFIEGESDANYTFKVWARKDSLSSAEYAAKLGPKVSRFFEEFFNVAFPLPKQDMAAVPDFSAGAMENWGLITYRESAFLYDPLVATASDKMRVASIISHELAHQWFGDLVTPSWWTDLWLNEGFASYVENIGLRETEPSMKSMDMLLVNDVHKAFALDALQCSHPISVEVHHPDEINAIFDTISYSKGASIIRMMSSFLTEETFRKGLSNYLKNFSYSSAKQDDLWSCLTDQAHLDGSLSNDVTVKTIMDTWTLQMGYPVVTVSRDQSGAVTVKQERFLFGESEECEMDEHDYKWWIPVTYASKSEASFDVTSPKMWMKTSEETKTVDGLSMGKEWVVFNVGQTGFYRVNYDVDNWQKIKEQLMEDFEVFPVSNRAQILDDSLNLARSGRLSYDIAFGLTTYLKSETEFVPIKAALDNFDYVKKMLAYSGSFGAFKNYLLSLVIPLYNEVDFSDSLTDPILEQRKRVELLQWACDLGHPPCVDASVELYEKWMKDPNNTSIISPNLKPIVYCTAIREGGPKEWKFAWQQYEGSLVGTEQKELLQALACSRDVWVLAELLDRTLSPGKGIKKQMVRYVIPAIAEHDIGSYMTWQFLRNRWGDIVDYFGSVSFILDNIMEAVSSSLNTEMHLEEMNAFREKYAGRFSSAARSVDQALERLENNMAWKKKSFQDIVEWLEANGYKSDI